MLEFLKTVRVSKMKKQDELLRFDEFMLELEKQRRIDMHSNGPLLLSAVALILSIASILCQLLNF